MVLNNSGPSNIGPDKRQKGGLPDPYPGVKDVVPVIVIPMDLFCLERGHNKKVQYSPRAVAAKVDPIN